MIQKLIILTILLFVSCKKGADKIDVNKNISQQTISSKIENGYYDFINFNCTSEDDMVTSCINEDNIKVRINYDKKPNLILFNIKESNYRYNLKSIFEGIGSNFYLYQNNENKILIFEEVYEFTSQLYVFQIIKNKIFYVDNIQFDIPDGKTAYKVQSSENGVNIILSVNSKENNKKFASFLSKVQLESDLAQSKVKNNVVTHHLSFDNWKGSYKITTKAISQYDNKEIDLLYTITLDNDTSGILSIGAEQVQDYGCEGGFKLINENNILHARGKCDQDDQDDFYLKYENEKYFIKSKRFINQDWQVLKKE